MSALDTDPARVSRRRWLRFAGRLGLVLAAGVLILVVVQHRRTANRLDTQRAALDAAQVSLEAERAALAQARGNSALTERVIAGTRSEIGLASDALTWIQGVTQNTLLEIAAVQAQLAETDTERYLVAANANETRQCFSGVNAAVAANRSGNDSAAAGALRFASDACTRTLAYATGARFPFDFPDPFVLRAGDYYAYSTNSGAGDIQTIRSRDLVTWELIGNALAGLPRWAVPNSTWAPAVLRRGGGYVVYYTVRDAASQRQCISRAVSSSPAGPFVDNSSAPLVCQLADGGSIDPSPFVDDDGRAFLLWKSEGFGGQPAALWSQELTADGLALSGAPGRLISADRSFEQGVVEAPSLVRDGGIYYLLYAAGNWNSRSYSIAYAACATPTGPCLKAPDSRVMTSGAKLGGPGGAEAFRDGDGRMMVAFHAFSEPDVGYPNSRYLHIAPMRVVGGRIVIDATT